MRAVAVGLVEVGEELRLPLSLSIVIKRSPLSAGSRCPLRLEVLSILLPHYVNVAVEASSFNGCLSEYLLVWSQV